VHTSPRCPDFLFTASRKDEVHLLLVECKGSSKPKYHLDQLAHALSQLGSVKFRHPLGGRPRIEHRHGFATYWPKDGGEMTVYGIDPPNTPRPSNERDFEGADVAPITVDVNDQFFIDLDTQIRDEIRAWMGGGESIRDDKNIDRVVVDDEAGEFVGVSSRFATSGRGAIEVFTGVERGLAESLSVPVDEAWSERLSKLSARWQVARRDDNSEADLEASTVRSVTRDGRLLQIRQL
jgi:hypothetical protein